eukprot:11460294-Karenia_brevis.AAC.1
MWSVEGGAWGVWGVRCGERGMREASGAWNMEGECRVWSVECGVWKVECGVWSVECGVWSVWRGVCGE